MIKTKLEMGFKDEMGKNYNISIDEAKDDLEPEDVKTTMNMIVEKDAFRNNDDKLIKAKSARLIKTEIIDILLE